MYEFHGRSPPCLLPAPPPAGIRIVLCTWIHFIRLPGPAQAEPPPGGLFPAVPEPGVFHVPQTAGTPENTGKHAQKKLYNFV
jgi:hypothetical protein